MSTHRLRVRPAAVSFEAAGEYSADQAAKSRQGISLIAIDSTVFSPTHKCAQRNTELAIRIRAAPPASGFVGALSPVDFKERAETKHTK